MTGNWYSLKDKIEFIQWPRQMKNVKREVKTYNLVENTLKDIDGYLGIEHTINRDNGHAVCNIKITPDLKLNPDCYALKIGGQIVYQSKSPELDNVFTVCNPILTRSLCYHEVKLLCLFQNTDENNDLLKNNKLPVYFTYDFLTYELDYIRQLVQVSHLISLGENSEYILRILGGTGEKAPKSNPFPKVGTTEDFFRDTIKTKN